MFSRSPSSVAPTLAFIVWWRELRANSAFRPPAGEVTRLRLAHTVEAALWAPIPVSVAAI